MKVPNFSLPEAKKIPNKYNPIYQPPIVRGDFY